MSRALAGEAVGSAATGFLGGDRTDIGLPRPRKELLQLLYGLHRLVILVLHTGRAFAAPRAADNLSAILVGWYGDEQAGAALADVLFGDANPAGCPSRLIARPHGAPSADIRLSATLSIGRSE